MAYENGHMQVWDPVRKVARLAHRVKLEQKLGRPLSPSDVVHHRNENKHDNRLRNLKVVARDHHTAHHKRMFETCLSYQMKQTAKRYCHRPHHAKGLCNTHHRQWLRTGVRPLTRKQSPKNKRIRQS